MAWLALAMADVAGKVAHDLLNEGIRLVAQIIECSPVRIFNQDQDIEILRAGCLAIQNFVVEDDLLLFLFVVNRLYRSGDLFQILVSQTSLGLYHRQSPDRAFVVRCVAASFPRIRLREANETKRKEWCGDRKESGFHHVCRLTATR